MIFPFIGYIILITGKINAMRNSINELKKLFVMSFITITNFSIILSVIWITKGLIGFIVIGNYVVIFMIYRFVLTSGLIMYMFIRGYKVLMWGVLPLVIFFVKMNVNIIILLYVILGVLMI